MKRLWIIVNGFDVKSTVKTKLFLGLLLAMNIVMGAGIWLTVVRLFLPGVDWLICFMGYPAVFMGLFGGIFYLYNH